MNKSMKITRNLRLWLEATPDAERSAYIKMAILRVKAIENELSRVRDPVARVRLLWKFVEEETALTNEGNIADYGKPTCGPHCNACCHINVDTSVIEVAALAAHVVEHQTPVSWQRLHAQVLNGREYKGEGSAARKHMPYAQRLCPFNGDDKNCSVYDARPARCRIYTVYSPPAECDTSVNFDAKTMSLFSAGAEGVLSALANMPNEKHGTLVELFWQHIHEKALLNQINWTDRT